MSSVSVVLIDNHAGFLRRAHAFLQSYEGFTVVGTAHSGEEVLPLARRLQRRSFSSTWSCPDKANLT